MRIPCLGEVSNTKILVGAVVIAASVYCAGPGLGEKLVEHIATPFLNAAAEAATGSNMTKLAENVSKYALEAGADKLQVVAETLANAGLKATGIFSYDCGRLFSEGIISDACGVVSDLVFSKIGANKALDFVCNFTHCIPV